MLTAQPCPRQIHPKSSLPYENTRLNHREGMKLHVFVRRDFWVSVLAPWLRHPALPPCPGQPALACRQCLNWRHLNWRHLSWQRLPACLRCKCHLGG